MQAGTHEVLLKYETKLFYGEGDRTLEQAAQGVVESSSLETFKTLLDMFLCDLIEMFLLQHRNWTR